MKDNSKRDLKIYSYLFIFLGIWDFVMLAIQYYTGKLNIDTIATENNVSVEMTKYALIVLLVLVAIIGLVKIFVGKSGLDAASGKSKKTTYITILKVMFAFEIIALIMYGIDMFAGKANYTSILTSIVNVTIIGDFLKNAKEVKKEIK